MPSARSNEARAVPSYGAETSSISATTEGSLSNACVAGFSSSSLSTIVRSDAALRSKRRRRPREGLRRPARIGIEKKKLLLINWPCYLRGFSRLRARTAGMMIMFSFFLPAAADEAQEERAVYRWQVGTFWQKSNSFTKHSSGKHPAQIIKTEHCLPARR